MGKLLIEQPGLRVHADPETGGITQITIYGTPLPSSTDSAETKTAVNDQPLRLPQEHASVTMTYNAPLTEYLMCVTDGGNTSAYFNTYILESDRITGPFKLVQHLEHFGEQAYFVNIPRKFISADGRTFWLCYTANFASNWNGMKIRSNPPGSQYGMCLQEVRLLAPKEAANLPRMPTSVAAR